MVVALAASSCVLDTGNDRGPSPAEEVEYGVDFVAELVGRQFPQWAGLPVAPVRSAGTDNALFRLGDELCVRLPRAARAAAQAQQEYRWLPKLAAQLTLRVPEPVALGEPTDVFERHWMILRWLPGQDATRSAIGDLDEAARALGQLVHALRSVDAQGAPPAGLQNAGRGVALALLDGRTRESLEALRAITDTSVLEAAWQAGVRADPWRAEPAWLHGDLHPSNMLVEYGKITAVIDFGLSAAGDPACDLMPAWTLLNRQSRATFREAAQVDDPTWTRGRAWAAYQSIVAWPYYIDRNPTLVALAERIARELAAD